MNEDEFEEKYASGDIIPSYEELTEEELSVRKNEFANMDRETKKLFNEVVGKQNGRILRLNDLMINSFSIISEAEDDIEDIEFSEEFLAFMQWYDLELRQGSFHLKYSNNEVIFEDLLNDGLEDEPEYSIFSFFNKMKEIKETNEIDRPLSGLEYESYKRYEVISTSNANLVKLFIDLPKINIESWEELKSHL
ncbi:MAG: hypothetical protein ACRC5M_04920 [Anaeroplasmataceae bacterium]